MRSFQKSFQRSKFLHQNRAPLSSVLPCLAWLSPFFLASLARLFQSFSSSPTATGHRFARSIVRVSDWPSDFRVIRYQESLSGSVSSVSTVFPLQSDNNSCRKELDSELLEAKSTVKGVLTADRDGLVLKGELSPRSRKQFRLIF